ncbi:DHH family phosphoesterase [Candidatus Uhrbacteria bacterium]|nr:DHH family phosphoesterase [Candidatus Uhrbacteria bacterium]
MDERRAQQAWERIQAAKHVLIVNDVRIDGDTMGSSLAVAQVLRRLHKRVTHISPMPISEAFNFLPGIREITFDTVALHDSTIDLILSFDCADGDHVVEFRSHVPHHPFLISFDHHVTNPRYGDLNLLIPEASSTGEVVWQFLKKNRVALSHESATCLLTAICTDTTFFSNDATNVVCLEAAAELGRLGARVHDVVRAMYANKPVSLLRVWGTCMERLQKLPDGTVVTYLKREDVPKDEDLDLDTSSLANFLTSLVHGAPMICVLVEKQDGSVKASLRGTTRNVAEIASRHGGGGHIKAAGFSVAGASVAQEGEDMFLVDAAGNHVPLISYF